MTGGHGADSPAETGFDHIVVGTGAGGAPLRGDLASPEVILAADAFNAPRLPMLSGIGPRAELRWHGLPVRAGLQDRSEVGMVDRTDREFPVLEDCDFHAPRPGTRPGVTRESRPAILKNHAHNTGGRVQRRPTDPCDTPPGNFRCFDEGTDKDAVDPDGTDAPAAVVDSEFRGRGVDRLRIVVDASVFPAFPDSASPPP
ncbi:hypothetical protein [Streptomyces sp. NPDC048282]|uniref:hypothetical protein n=1 Tax=Streptomyces sp. NPDC048282 TaxID=3365528 RepID=UPI00371381ED